MQTKWYLFNIIKKLTIIKNTRKKRQLKCFDVLKLKKIKSFT